jgi:glycogen synthase
MLAQQVRLAKERCEATVDQVALSSTLQIGLERFSEDKGGGLNRYFSALTDCLRLEGVTVHGIVRTVCAPNAPIVARLRAARSAVHEVVARERPDVVASHFALFAFPCLDLIRHIPLIVHFHGPWAAESQMEGEARVTTSIKFFIEKLVYSRCEKAIVLTGAFGNVLHRTYGVPLEKITAIPGGVDVQRFNVSQSRGDARMRLGLPLDRPLIVAVRRLVKRMGLENLITSFFHVSERHKDALLVIVGSGTLSETLKRQVKEYGLADRVIFTGRVSEENLALYYRAANISVVPSVALEGFGLVVAESLACGTPALVTPVGGLPEVVSALSEHLVFEGTSCDAITERLGEALAGRLPLPSAEMCAAYARAHFSWPIIAKRVKSVYGSIL